MVVGMKIRPQQEWWRRYTLAWSLSVSWICHKEDWSDGGKIYLRAKARWIKCSPSEVWFGCCIFESCKGLSEGNNKAQTICQGRGFGLQYYHHGDQGASLGFCKLNGKGRNGCNKDILSPVSWGNKICQ